MRLTHLDSFFLVFFFKFYLPTTAKTAPTFNFMVFDLMTFMSTYITNRCDKARRQNKKKTTSGNLFLPNILF